MRQRAGLLLLVAVVVVVAVLSRCGRGPSVPATGPNGATTGPSGTNSANANGGAQAVTLRGFVGGEKINFLRDPDVVKILRERYGLDVNFDRRGSLEMVEQPLPAGQDFLWPSSQVALELFKESKRPFLQADIIFNSPIILYSWASVTEALIKQGVVRKVRDAYYVVDFPKLVKLVNANTSWSAVGLSQLYGPVTIYSTDPTVSNSGNMFAGLLANILNGGQVANDATIGKVLPTVKAFFDRQGFMEQSSDVIFQQFLNKGIGDKPIIVGYESQLLEYSVTQPQALTQRREAVRMLYPKPTVWSSHPLIALTENGKRLSAALQDKDIQRLAWQRHGFRSVSGADNSAKAFPIEGLPETIENVIPMPAPRVMKRILATLGGK